MRFCYTRDMTERIPVVLFTYKRRDVLERTLACLRENNVPLIIVYSDAGKNEKDQQGVASVRDLLSGIDWCEVERHDRTENWGLGRNILAGVSEVLERFESVLVWEDDLICVPGTYNYLCSALRAYRNASRVMSVTGWTNRHLIPSDVKNLPYLDGRAECWVWGTWRRAWQGMMDETALEKIERLVEAGGDPARYGGDLPFMAKQEQEKNIWAVRWLYHHMLHGGLCVRPPWSMVEHIGFGEGATNAVGKNWLANGALAPCPPIPHEWPAPVEHPQCARLHRKMCPRPWSDRFPRLVALVRLLQAKLSHRGAQRE